MFVHSNGDPSLSGGLSAHTDLLPKIIQNSQFSILQKFLYFASTSFLLLFFSYLQVFLSSSRKMKETSCEIQGLSHLCPLLGIWRGGFPAWEHRS